jgi:hypothetical protein
MSGNINLQLRAEGAVSLVAYEPTRRSFDGLGCVSSGGGGELPAHVEGWWPFCIKGT